MLSDRDATRILLAQELFIAQQFAAPDEVDILKVALDGMTRGFELQLFIRSLSAECADQRLQLVRPRGRRTHPPSDRVRPCWPPRPLRGNHPRPWRFVRLRARWTPLRPTRAQTYRSVIRVRYDGLGPVHGPAARVACQGVGRSDERRAERSVRAWPFAGVGQRGAPPESGSNPGFAIPAPFPLLLHRHALRPRAHSTGADHS